MVVRHQADRFVFVNEAHHFLAEFLPIRQPVSRDALAAFMQVASLLRVTALEAEAVLLRCVLVADRHTSNEGPRLIERWLSAEGSCSQVLTKFERCMEEAIRQHSLDKSQNLWVRMAITAVADGYLDPSFRPRSVVRALGIGRERLAAQFRRETGLSLAQHIRNVRLDHAADRLLQTTASIKEIWAAVGYNHPSNFVHDFKGRYGITPREYRRDSGVRGLTRAPASDTSPPVTTRSKPRTGGRKVLIIDDDQGTRETLGGYLRLGGYDVAVASTAREGIDVATRLLPDAILLDYHLPDQDGLTCLRLLRRNHNAAKVVLFTADWELDVDAADLCTLKATVASKLCDLEEMERLVAH